MTDGVLAADPDSKETGALLGKLGVPGAFNESTVIPHSPVRIAPPQLLMVATARASRGHQPQHGSTSPARNHGTVGVHEHNHTSYSQG